MKKKGYIYTFIIVALVLIIMSLISYYIMASQPAIDDVINQVRTDELYYLVESSKKDYERAISISAQRSLVYLIDYSIENNAGFAGYRMRNCTSLNYTINGSQAAMVELMMCGTLNGISLGDLMANHTLPSWTQRVKTKGDELNFNIDITPKSIEIIPYDSWSFYVVTRSDFLVYDKLNQSFYRGFDVPVLSMVSIFGLEDPLYSTMTRSPELVRYFSSCSPYGQVNYTTINSWINSECYLQSSEGPSFFDRLDGNLYLTQKYLAQSQRVGELGFPSQAIGLDSVVDLDRFDQSNVTAQYNLTWFDHSYWRNVSAYCWMPGLTNHLRFRVDSEHAVDYQMKGLNCKIEIENSFNPPYIEVPLNTTITWLNINAVDSCRLDINAQWFESLDLAPSEQYSWVLNQSGRYDMSCTLTPSASDFTGVIQVSQ